MTDKNRVLLIVLTILGFFVYFAIQQGWFSSITSGEAFSNIEEWFESDFEDWGDEKLPPSEEQWRPEEEPVKLKHMAI